MREETMTAVDEVERAIVDAVLDAPRTVAALRKRLPAAVRRPPSEIAALLARLVDRRQVFALGDGARRAFSARDPAALLDADVPALLGDDIVTPGELKKRVRARHPGLEVAVDAWLLRQHVVHVLAAGARRYIVTRDPAEATIALVREALRAGPLDEKRLVTAVRKKQPAFAALAAAAIDAAVTGQRIYVQTVYSSSGAKNERYSLTPLPADLSALVRGPANALRKLATKIGVAPSELLAAVAAQLGAAVLAAPDDPAMGRSGDRDEDDVQRVRSAFLHLVEASPAGDVISLPALRRSLSLEKRRFDAAVLALAERDEVALHLHDLPAALPRAERDALVVHPDGTHFIGIAPRRRPRHVVS
jgi:hypothetical protein